MSNQAPEQSGPGTMIGKDGGKITSASAPSAGSISPAGNTTSGSSQGSSRGPQGNG